MFYDADIFADWPEDEDPPRGVEAFLIWLKLWWELFCEAGETLPPAQPMPPMRNRQDLRDAAHHARCGLPIARNLTPFLSLGGRGLSPKQFLELRCRLSLRGRVWIYELPCRGRMIRGRVKRALRRALCLSSSGVWAAHLWPS